MTDKHADTPNATKTATGEAHENRGNDCASQQTCHSHRAGPGRANRLPAAEHSAMNGQLRRRSAPYYRT
jgi:hypothetical protein